VLSNVTGTWLGDDEATDPAYWAGHLRRPIRFSDALAEVAGLGRPITVELGPGRTLTNLATHDGLKLRSLPGVFESRTDLEIFLTTVGRLWTTGADITWAELWSGP
jgi:acyl transferase domain-containing protein